jgi:hypothetical protein
VCASLRKESEMRENTSTCREKEKEKGKGKLNEV